MPTPIKRLGMKDRYGESGAPLELISHFGLDGKGIAKDVAAWVKAVPQYKPGY